MSKRILSFILTIVLALSYVTTGYAENNAGNTGNSQIVYRPPSGAGATNPPPVTEGNGVRISFATAQPIVDAGITALSGSYTEEDLESKKTDINNLCNTMYWEAGSHAINYFQAKSQDPYLGVVNSGSYGFIKKSIQKGNLSFLALLRMGA